MRVYATREGHLFYFAPGGALHTVWQGKDKISNHGGIIDYAFHLIAEGKAKLVYTNVRLK